MLPLQRSRTLPALIGLAFVVVACDRQKADLADTTTGSAVAPGAAIAPADTGSNLTTMSDANLVSILSSASAAEVEYSQVGVERATNAQVKEFARMMVRDHGQMRDSIDALAQRLGVTPAAPERATEMGTEARQDLEDLRGKSGADFDKEFMEEQVDMHEDMLNLLEDLDDDSNTPDILRAIEGAKATVRAHLDRAKQLKDTVDG